MSNEITPKAQSFEVLKLIGNRVLEIQDLFHQFANLTAKNVGTGGQLNEIVSVAHLYLEQEYFLVKCAEKTIRFSWGTETTDEPRTTGVVAVHRIPASSDIEEVTLLGLFTFDFDGCTNLSAGRGELNLTTPSHAATIVTHYLYLAQQHAFVLRQTPQHR